MTKGDDTGMPEIPAPEQRLATTKPRDAAEPALTQTAQLTDDSPHVTQTASRNTTSAKPAQSVSRKTNGDNYDSFRADKNPGAVKTALDFKSKAADQAKPDTNQVADFDPKELMGAFSEYPPEVQKEALRRMIAATSRSADRTNQPNALQAELAKSMQSLPKLPPAKNKVSDVTPTRIASDKPTAVSISDVASKDDASEGLVTTEVESAVVKSISDMPDHHADVKVQTVAASRADDDETMVAQASVAPSEGVGEESSVKVSPASFSEDVLYAALLKQMASVPDGETEAEKNGRLIRLRHLMVLSGDPDAAVEKVEGMSEAEQEYLRHQLLGLWTMIDPQGHPVPSRRFSTAIPQIREAAKFAAAATDSLELRSLAFCTEIESYGQIKTFPGNRFDSGQQVILYCEIENFTVKQLDDGFATHLQGSYDIYNAENEKVVSQLLPADEQVSANFLRDYFIAYQMFLPQQLSSGTYRMQLTMEDVNGKKYGQASVPFEIAK